MSPTSRAATAKYTTGDTMTWTPKWNQRVTLPETRDLPGPAHRACGPSYFLYRPRPPLGPALASLNGEVLIIFLNQSAAQ